MIVTINGVTSEIAAGMMVDAAIATAGHTGSGFGIAIALNGEVVPRSEWTVTEVTEGDRIEVLVAAQGG